MNKYGMCLACFRRYVLQITDGIHDMGSLRWELLLCLFISWLAVFLCLFKGVKSLGKVGITGIVTCC